MADPVSLDFNEDKFNGLETNVEKREYLARCAYRQVGATVFGRGVSEDNLQAYWRPGLVMVVENGSHAEHWSNLRTVL